MNAIKLTLTASSGKISSFSRFFGAPIVPESLFETVNSLEGDIMFFAQLDLAEATPFDTENKLPKGGILYLFLDTGAYPYRAISFYTKDEPRYVIDDFNSEVSGFEYLTEPFSVSFSVCESDADGTRLLGVPTAPIELDGDVLMQFDPLDGECGFLSEIDGYAFFTFKEGNLSPENIRFEIDRS